MTDAATRKLIQDTARATAKAVAGHVGRAAARDTLIAVGIDPDDPIAAQENAAALRRIAEHAPTLEKVAVHYQNPEVLADIHFAGKVRRAYNSTRNRVLAGAGAVIMAWMTGLFKKIGLG